MFDREIADLARQQHGLVTREQALRLSDRPQLIKYRLSRGRWRAVVPGVYAIAGAPDTPELALMAACLAGGPSSAVSHRTATALWSRVAFEPPIEVTTPREARRTSTTVIVHRSRDLLPEHVTRAGQLPITTPARTLVDLGQVLPWWEVGRVVERFLTRGLVTMPALRAAVVVHSKQGRRGVGVLRRVVVNRALGDDIPDSVLESALADVCQAHGLPRPELQHEITVNGRQRFIDFSYPAVRLAIEVDGYEFHSSPTQFEADRIRGNELLLAGWQVLHFTWTQVIHRPAYVAATLRRALGNLGSTEVATSGAKLPRTPCSG